jgi:hypothetical protein
MIGNWRKPRNQATRVCEQRRRGTFRPALEVLEDRLALSSSTWQAPAGAGSLPWNNTNNWTAGIPGVTAGVDEAVFDGTSTRPCTLDVVGGITLKKVTLDAAYNTGILTLDKQLTINEGLVGPNPSIFAGGTIDGTAILSFDKGTANWTGTTFKLRATDTDVFLRSGTTMNISGNGLKTVDGCTIANHGTVNMAGLGDLWLRNGARFFTDQSAAQGAQVATFTAQGRGSILSLDDTSDFQVFGGGVFNSNPAASGASEIGVSAKFRNEGVVNIQSGILWLGRSSTSKGDGTLATTAGKYNIDGDCELRLDRDTAHTFDGAFVTGNGKLLLSEGTQVTILGTVNVMYLVDTGGQFGNGTVPSLITGSGTLNILSTYDWNGGSWSGSGKTQIGTQAHLNIMNSAADDIDVNGRKLENYGFVIWNSIQDLYYSNGAAITNHPGAIFEIKKDTFILDLGGAGHFTNKGTGVLKKTGGAGTATIEIPYKDDGGRVRQQSGTLDLKKKVALLNGIFELDPETAIVFSDGIEQEGGTVIAAEDALIDVIGTYDLSGGTLTMTDATLTTTDVLDVGSAATVTATGLIESEVETAGTWTLGDIYGSPADLLVDGNFTQSGGSLSILSGSFAVAEDLTHSGGSLGVGEGILSVAGDFSQSGGGTSVAGITPAGILEVAGSFTQSGGTFTVVQFALLDVGESVTLSGGQLSLDDLGSLQFGAGLFIQSGGRLSGSGNLAGNVFNSGILDVGCNGTIGNIYVSGNYTQTATGVLHFEVANDELLGQLHVFGTATLAGTLQVTAPGGSPASPFGVTLMTFGSRSGTFNSHVLPALGSGTWVVGYDTPLGTLTLAIQDDPGGA